MYIFQWLSKNISTLFTTIVNFFGWFVELGEAIIEWLAYGSTQGFSNVFGLFSDFTDSFWNFIQQFNIFDDFGVSILYSWLPNSVFTGAISYMFTFVCLIGSLRLLKKIVPFW